jgi:hypothetical protein
MVDNFSLHNPTRRQFANGLCEAYDVGISLFGLSAALALGVV